MDKSNVRAGFFHPFGFETALGRVCPPGWAQYWCFRRILCGFVARVQGYYRGRLVTLQGTFSGEQGLGRRGWTRGTGQRDWAEGLGTGGVGTGDWAEGLGRERAGCGLAGAAWNHLSQSRPVCLSLVRPRLALSGHTKTPAEDSAECTAKDPAKDPAKNPESGRSGRPAGSSVCFNGLTGAHPRSLPREGAVHGRDIPACWPQI